MTAPIVSAPIVTGLYVPGNRPDRFDKAVATGAQIVILDLEDAVPQGEKADARDAVVDWLLSRADSSGPVIQVRVDADFAVDVAALRAADVAVELRLPKVESSDLDDVNPSGLRPFPITPIIESALGLERAFAIASHPSVTRLALGESDLSSDLGSSGAAVMEHARLRLLVAARAAGLPAPMMSAYTDIPDLDGLRVDTERGRELGLFGRVAVHPRQLDVIRSVFRPSDADLAWAREVLAVTSGGGVARLASGAMVDPAMIGRATTILARE